MEHITVYLPWNDVLPWFKSSASYLPTRLTQWLKCVEASQLSLMGSTPRKCQFYQRSPKGQSLAPSCLSYNNAAKLQSDLTALQQWAQKCQMKFNTSKCHVLRISRKQNPVESYYVLMGKVLHSVTHHPYLGVELSRNLDRSQHVNNKVMKANRSLGRLRLNLGGCPYGVKEAVYKGPLQPDVEYTSSVWDPHLKK